MRVFGAFANLGEKIRSDFGETPVSAFSAVLKRLESDPAYSSIDPKQAVPLLFGLLGACPAWLIGGGTERDFCSGAWERETSRPGYHPSLPAPGAAFFIAP